MSMGEWIYDEEWEYWSFMVGGSELVIIEPRPAYCDRGHWYAKPVGMSWIDAAHGFPRYYMDLDRAKAELSEWVTWRLECDKRDQPT